MTEKSPIAPPPAPAAVRPSAPAVPAPPRPPAPDPVGGAPAPAADGAPPRVLIVGAGGFIGGHLAAEALARGLQVTCGVRPSTSRRYLTDERLQFVNLDCSNPSLLARQLSEAGRFDWIVYNLGVTKCTDFSTFNTVNFQYLRNFITALKHDGGALMPRRLVYMSSLSALGPGDEKGYTPLRGTDIPAPNTRYGVSKLKAETLLEATEGLDWTILRPTGVYGPHERDYLMMIKSIAAGWDLGVGYRRQMLTFIYVADLARAAFDALASPQASKRKYIISEPRAYTQADFRSLVKRLLGKKVVVPLRLPLWMAWVASAVAEKVGVLRMKPATLNRDKYRIMKQRNWACDTSDAERDLGFRASWSLEDGLRATIDAWRLDEQAAKKGGVRQ